MKIFTISSKSNVTVSFLLFWFLFPPMIYLKLPGNSSRQVNNVFNTILKGVFKFFEAKYCTSGFIPDDFACETSFSSFRMRTWEICFKISKAAECSFWSYSSESMFNRDWKARTATTEISEKISCLLMVLETAFSRVFTLLAKSESSMELIFGSNVLESNKKPSHCFFMSAALLFLCPSSAEIRTLIEFTKFSSRM